MRGLINVVERAVLLCEGAEITPLDLPSDIRLGFQDAASKTG